MISRLLLKLRLCVHPSVVAMVTLDEFLISRFLLVVKWWATLNVLVLPIRMTLLGSLWLNVPGQKLLFMFLTSHRRMLPGPEQTDFLGLVLTIRIVLLEVLPRQCLALETALLALTLVMKRAIRRLSVL